MINFSKDPKVNQVANEELEYFVSKFKLNSNEYVLRAKAELIIKKSLKDWKPSKGNLKTYLSSQLQQLNREIYKNQTVYIPENQQVLMYKARTIIDNYKDTHGGLPTPEELAKECGITEKKAKNILYLYMGPTKAHHDTESMSIQSSPTYSSEEIINSIPDPLHRRIAHDLYVKDIPKEKLYSKYKIKQTKFYGIKKDIDNRIQNYAESMNTLQ